MQGSAILFSEMTPPTGEEENFNRWYDEEHIPIRMGAPGFRSAQRYRDGSSLNYLAVYEMETVDALKSPEYTAIKSQPSQMTSHMLASVDGFTRYIGNEIAAFGNTIDRLLAAPVLYAVFFSIPGERLADFDDWYNADHIPILLEDPRWIGVRRFDVLDGSPGNYNRLALHYLADRAVLDGEARRRARETDWRARLAREPWFKGHYVTFDRWADRQLARTAEA